MIPPILHSTRQSDLPNYELINVATCLPSLTAFHETFSSPHDLGEHHRLSLVSFPALALPTVALLQPSDIPPLAEEWGGQWWGDEPHIFTPLMLVIVCALTTFPATAFPREPIL